MDSHHLAYIKLPRLDYEIIDSESGRPGRLEDYPSSFICCENGGPKSFIIFSKTRIS